MMYLRLTIILLLFHPLISKGQELPSVHLTTADGLPHLQVRDLFVDSHGFIWIATLGGVGIYDGREIFEFRNAPRLSEEYVSRVFLNDNQVYISDKGKLQVIQDDSLVSVIEPPSEFSYKEFGPLSSPRFGAIKGDTLYSIKGDSLLTIGPIPDWYLEKIGSGKKKRFAPMVDLKELYALDADSMTLIKAVVSPDSFSRKNYYADEKIKIGTYNYISKNDDQTVLLILDDERYPLFLYVLTDDSVIQVASRGDEDQWMKKVRPEAPLFTHAHAWGPLYRLNGEEYMPYYKEDISEVFGMAYDDDRTIVGTDAGIFVFFRNGLEEIPLTRCSYIWSAVPFQGDIIMNCHSRKLLAIDKSGNEVEISSSNYSEDEKGDVLGVNFLSNYATNGHTAVFGGFFSISVLDSNGMLHVLPHEDHIEAIDYDESRRSYYAASQQLHTFDADQRKLTPWPGSAPVVHPFLPLNDLEILGDEAWIAGNSGIGLYSLRDSQPVTAFTFPNGYPCKIAVSLVSYQNRLFSGGSCGLHTFDSIKQSFEPIHPEVISRRINQMVVTPDGLLVVVLSDNLYVIDLTRDDFPILAHMDPDAGFLNVHEPSENGASLVDNRFVYIPHSLGLYRLDLNVIRTRRQASSFGSIPYIRVRDGGKEKILLKDEPIYLEGNSAEFKPLLVYEFGLNWKFRYKKNAGEWSSWIDQNDFFVDNLDHGTNAVSFEAMDHTGNTINKTVTVIASEPFWKRNYTQYSLLFLIVTLFGVVLALRFEYVRRMGKYKKDLDKNRLKTIQSLSSPHFLFNALTSLQYSILNKPRTESNESLLSLSRTFRALISEKEVNSHGTKVITLQKELELVTDFAYLYNLQYEQEKTEVVLDVDPAIQTEEVMVPQLLIEPFVENALKHAYSRKDSNKRIVVTIRTKGEFFLAEITDKGKGFNVRDEKSEESMGLKLAYERFHLLRKLGFSCDLDIQSSPGIGTTVRISYQYKQ